MLEPSPQLCECAWHSRMSASFSRVPPAASPPPANSPMLPPNPTTPQLPSTPIELSPARRLAAEAEILAGIHTAAFGCGSADARQDPDADDGFVDWGESEDEELWSVEGLEDGSEDEEADPADEEEEEEEDEDKTRGCFGKSRRAKMSEESQRIEHWKSVDSSFQGFRCGCSTARREGKDSCLEAFNKGELRGIHRETYGSGGSSGGSGLLHTHVLPSIHRRYWAAKKALPHLDELGRSYRIGPLVLCEKVVCKASFMRAVGGTRSAHKMKIGLVMRGYSPEALSEVHEAMLHQKVEKDSQGAKAARGSYATQWWADELILHDWLPNEQAIQFKGPFWNVLHKECYVPIAKARSGHKALEYKAWKAKMKAGGKLVCEQLKDCRDVSKIRVVRSARHSKFPECTECQRLRAAYLKVLCDAGSSDAARATAQRELREHMSQWQTDRACALRLKDHAAPSTAYCVYECDDKCGSHWCELPVPEGGRDNKALAKAKFKFAVQCNVVVGGGGVNRFLVMPKHLGSGGNFGLTSLLSALRRAYDMGRLSQSAGVKLLRHTDGGSDNINLSTHLFHWLLVWLGIFDEVEWFRFDAGHSHTELADRFFSMLKRLFSVDGQARPKRNDGFLHLNKELEETFRKSAEPAELEYLFANHDFNEWFTNAGFNVHHDFGRISYDNVFRCKYDETCWKHGCVKVTFKPKLSWQGGGELDCEWGPVRVIRKKCRDGIQRDANVTTQEGIEFVMTPPRVLLREPQREDFKGDAIEAAKCIDELIQKRSDTPSERLSDDEVAHWKALAAVYRSAPRAGQVPDMPHTPEGSRCTLAGCPSRVLPTLKAMRRFPRPLLYWDPFTDEPPDAWPSPEAAREAARGSTEARKGAWLGPAAGGAVPAGGRA